MPDGFFSQSLLMTVPRPRSGEPHCGACGLFRTCRSPKMEPDGRGRRRVLVVGEAPGAEEDRDGAPLVGASGQMTAAALSRAGLDMRADCWLTNALICRPPGNKIRDPRAVDHCRPNLLRTVEELRPHTIILMGRTAVRSVIGYLWRDEIGGIERWTGWRIPSQRWNAWVCPTHHPSRLMHDPDPVLANQYAAHVAAAAGLAGRPWPDGPPDYPGAVEAVLSPDDAAAWVRTIRGGTVAFDYENNMLKADSRAGRIVCCSVCWNGERTMSFPWAGAAVPAVLDLLRDPDVGKIASNLKHEERWTRARLGTRVRGWRWDTMLAAHALDSRRGVSGLKFQSFVRLGVDNYNAHIEPFLRAKGGNTPNKIREVDLSDLLTYCGTDSLLEYMTARRQMREMGVDPC